MPYINSHSTYLAEVKPWKVRNMIEGYLRAQQAFEEILRTRNKADHLPSFESLKKISDELFEVKEIHHLIFQRTEELEKHNGHHKFVPGYAETSFIDHIGLLFHKVMVARELRYILQRYAHDRRNWESHYEELQYNLQRIEELFEDGLEITRELIHCNSDNVLLLAFLFENSRWVSKCFKTQPAKLLQELVSRIDLANAYFQIASYYFESGWKNRAADAIDKSLALDHHDKRALELKQKLTGSNGAAQEPASAENVENNVAQPSHSLAIAE